MEYFIINNRKEGKAMEANATTNNNINKVNRQLRHYAYSLTESNYSYNNQLQESIRSKPDHLCSMVYIEAIERNIIKLKELNELSIMLYRIDQQLDPTNNLFKE